jgi:hypothetical protein
MLTERSESQMTTDCMVHLYEMCVGNSTETGTEVV